MELILLGYIARSFGIKGGVSIKLFNDDSQNLVVGKKISLVHNDKTIPVTVTNVMDGGRYFFHEISDKTAADALVGAKIFVERTELASLEDDEFYLCDLLGAEVNDNTGKLLGHVVGFSHNNAQTLFEIKTTTGQFGSLPSVRPIITSIDYDKCIVTMDANFSSLLALE